MSFLLSIYFNKNMYFTKPRWCYLSKQLSSFGRKVQFRNYVPTCENPVYHAVAVVTGGAQGIGLECVKEILRNEARGVVIGDVHSLDECIETLKKEFDCKNVITKLCDITKADQFEDLFKIAKKRWNAVDLLLNNAGILNDEEWERQIETNVIATVRGTYIGLEYMSKHKQGYGGIIVNFASIFGLQHFAASPVYVGANHFLVGFSSSLGDPYHYKRTAVKIYTMCPGITKTQMIRDVEKYAHVGFDPEIGKLLIDELGDLPEQETEAVSKALIQMLIKGSTGSVWVTEGGELYEIKYPDRKTFRVQDEFRMKLDKERECMERKQSECVEKEEKGVK